MSKLSGIARVHEEHLDARVLRHRRGLHRMGTIAILGAGGRDTHGQQESQGVDDHMILAPFGFLTRVILAARKIFLDRRSMRHHTGPGGQVP